MSHFCRWRTCLHNPPPTLRALLPPPKPLSARAAHSSLHALPLCTRYTLPLWSLRALLPAVRAALSSYMRGSACGLYFMKIIGI